MARVDRYRPRWQVTSPAGQQLTAEYDRLRGLWRITPGEYVRRELADALAQATGHHPDATWIQAFEREINLSQKRE
jgi:hypothetical protein